MSPAPQPVPSIIVEKFENQKYRDNSARVQVEGVGVQDIVSGGEQTLPRFCCTTDFKTNGSGGLNLTYWTALQTIIVSGAKITTGSTAAASATLTKIGIYAVDPITLALTLLGSSANVAGGFTGTYNTFTVPFQSGVQLIAGGRYAVANLQVAATAANIIGQWCNAQWMGSRPRLCAAVAGQSDLPSTIADGSISDADLAIYTLLQ